MSKSTSRMELPVPHAQPVPLGAKPARERAECHFSVQYCLLPNRTHHVEAPHSIQSPYISPAIPFPCLLEGDRRDNNPTTGYSVLLAADSIAFRRCLQLHLARSELLSARHPCCGLWGSSSA